MVLSRVLGQVGRFFISLGLLTLLFVAYQLWGTGILTAQAQGDLQSEFDALLEQVADIEVASDETAPVAATPGAVDSADDTATDDAAALAATEAEAELAAEAAEVVAAERERLSKAIWRAPGQAIGQLSMPTIGIDWTVVEGVGTEDLRKGPGHYPGTPMPGMPGNVSIAGHRTTWGAPFSRIDELAPGDIITLRTVQGTFEYRVVEQDSGKGHFIVSPDRVDVLDQDFTEYPNRLTLTACHPKFSARQRIIVVAELLGEPAEFIPPPADLGPLKLPSLATETFGEEDLEQTPDQTNDLPGDPDVIAAEAEEDAEAAADQEDSADTEDDVAAIPVDSSPPTTSPSLQAAADDFGQGLSGDRSAIFPAIMWAIATTAIAAAAGFIAKRWKKLPTYALTLAPFAVVLFLLFAQIDRALPSY